MSKSEVVAITADFLTEKGTGTLDDNAKGGSAAGGVAGAVLDNHASLTFQDFHPV